MKTCLASLGVLLLALAPAAADETGASIDTGCAPLWYNSLVPGFGAGSYAQGDRGGGTIQLTAQLVGLACLGVGLGMASDWIPSESWTEGAAWMVAAAGVTLGSRFWGLVRAIAYDDAVQRGWQRDGALPLTGSLAPVLMNVLLGFGSGSLLHDDLLGASVGFLGETIGYGLLIWWDYYASRAMDGLGWENLLLYAGSGLVIAARGVWGIVRPLRVLEAR